ncbi:hypothetical protein [Nevskia ramosa]|uniref:hypothetical protein n=1 Tax=Nevskia ramosa TaxID=64002 RepID=UPI0012EBCDFA|nr:hypothetical protein [Nevskia ramosa]
MIRNVRSPLALLVCASFAAHGSPGLLCPGLKSAVVPDYQVTEDQLTYAAAVKALAFIEQHKETSGVTYRFGLANSEIRLRGYLLRSFAASSDDQVRRKYQTEFCQWLKTAAWRD